MKHLLIFIIIFYNILAIDVTLVNNDLIDGNNDDDDGDDDGGDRIDQLVDTFRHHYHHGYDCPPNISSTREWMRIHNENPHHHSSTEQYNHYNETNPFPVRIVGIFVADSELPYTLELAKPSINIAIEKAKRLFPSIRWENAIFRNGSNRCTSNFAGVFAAEEFYLRRVTVFIGPSWYYVYH